jgi:hypothetical protein
MNKMIHTNDKGKVILPMPKTISEIDINPKDQQDILNYIRNINNPTACEALQCDMSTKAISFSIEIIKAFVE